MNVLTKGAEMELLRSIATSSVVVMKRHAYVPGTALFPSPRLKPFAQVELNFVASRLGEAWVVGKHDDDVTQQWIRLVSSSDVPVLQINITQIAASAARFGINQVSVNDVLNRYFTNVRQQYQVTLDDVTRALRTWGKERNIVAFNELFEQLRREKVGEETMPLMMSALAESYVLRSALPARDEFRSWLIERSNDAFTIERTRRIFSRFF